MTYIEVFFFLQVMDFMTTLVGLRLGGTELTPFVRWLMMVDPVAGLSMAKLVGFVLGGICLWRGKTRVIHWVNWIFAGLVIWNLHNILRAVGA